MKNIIKTLLLSSIFLLTSTAVAVSKFAPDSRNQMLETQRWMFCTQESLKAYNQMLKNQADPDLSREAAKAIFYECYGKRV